MARDTAPYSIAFDLDGTLIDTAPDLIRVLDETVAQDGLGRTQQSGARARIGYGSRALLRYAYGQADMTADEAQLDSRQAEFLERYAYDIAQLSVPFPGVTETLGKLKRAGIRLSVCTNKPGYLARPLMEKLGMTRFFDRIVGSDDIERNKPHSDHIFASVGHKERGKIIMVGDGAPDSQSARHGKVPCVLMAYGYSTQDFYALRADRVLRRFRDLPAALQRHWDGPKL